MIQIASLNPNPYLFIVLSLFSFLLLLDLLICDMYTARE